MRCLPLQSQSLFGLCKCFALASPQPQTVPVPCNLLLCEACLLTAQQTITAVAVARYTCGFIGAGPNLDGASVFNALEDFQVTGVAGVPTVFLGLLDYMATNNKKLNYLKMAAVGGAACPPKVLEKFDRCDLQKSVMLKGSSALTAVQCTVSQGTNMMHSQLCLYCSCKLCVKPVYLDAGQRATLKTFFLGGCRSYMMQSAIVGAFVMGSKAPVIGTKLVHSTCLSCT